MVHEVTGTDDFRQQLSAPNKLCVVDFTATWCGPCRRVAPAFENLSHKYPDVNFLKVVESTCQELIVQLGIRAFPTFRLYVGGNQVDEVQGADIGQVESKILQHRPQQAFTGTGQSLGGGGAPLSTEDARAARLARLNQGAAAAAPAPVPAAAAPAAPSAGVVPTAEDAALIQAMAASIAAHTQAPRRNDPMLLNSLLEMGFPENRAKKAVNNNADLESAITWLEQHENDPDIDDPVPDDEVIPKTAEEGAPTAMDTEEANPDGGDAPEAPAEGTAQSLKCGDCGALLRDMVAAEMHAAKTQHMNFEESTECVKALTPEEKAAKVAQLKQKLAERRAAREEGEKVDEIQREKQRRFQGKEMAKTREELEKQARLREAQARKKEKQAEKAERERLKKLIEQDKRERAANKGKLTGKLGAEGYNPSMPSVNVPYGAGAEEKQDVAAGGGAKEELTTDEKIQKAIVTVSRYRTGGDGLVCLKTLKAYTSNALKPEEKFRTINMENNAFRSRVKPFVGGVALLKALGFVKNDEEGTLVLSEEMKNEDLLRDTVSKLEAAMAAYQS